MGYSLVRRLMREGLTDPRNLDGLALWKDSTDQPSMRNDAGNVPASGDSIKLWSDKSGNSAVNCFVLNGVAGNYGSSPDSAAVSFSERFAGAVDSSRPDWSPASAQNLISKRTAGQYTFIFYLNTNGTVSLAVSTDGNATAATYTSSAALADVAFSRYFVGFEADLNNGSGSSVSFFTSPDFGQTWSALGVAQTSVSSYTLPDRTAPLEIGAQIGGTAGLGEANYYRVFMTTSTLSATKVFDANFALVSKLAPSFTESSSNAATVTINTTGATGARISGARDAYWGGLAATMPVLTAASAGTCLTGNGTSTGMKSAPFNLPQPVTRLTVLNQKTWTAGDVLLDGNSANSGAVVQTTSTPQINLNAGSSVAGNTGLALNTRAVVIQTINGASSALRVNRGTATTGNAGATAPNGNSMFSDGAGANFADMEVCADIVYASVLDENYQYRLTRLLSRSTGVLLA